MAVVRILLAGGGTGGHLYPLAAVARTLKRRVQEQGLQLELRYLGPASFLNAVLAQEGITVRLVAASKLRRYVSWRTIFELPRLCWGLFQALVYVFWFMPDAAFSKGGPGALSVAAACWFYRIPLVIHESDAVPSLTTRLTGRWAQAMLAGFPAAEPSAAMAVGNPVREELLQPIEQAAARRWFGLDAARPTLLVMGGSQGASRINEFLLENLKALLVDYQIIHQAGTQQYRQCQAQFPEGLPPGYILAAYLDQDLNAAYAVAALVVCRAGAETIFELAALGKPAILIPLPEAAQDHQRHNAAAYAQTGAAVVLEHNDLSYNVLRRTADLILKDPERYAAMAAAARRFYRPEAAERIVQEILRLIPYRLVRS